MSSTLVIPDESKSLIRLFGKSSRELVAKFLDSSQRDVDEIYEIDSSSVNPYRWTALLCACRNLNLEAVEELLERGADPNLTVARAGFTPMMAVTIASSKANGQQSVACATRLKSAGVKIPDALSFNKRTLLTRAVKNGSDALAKFFIQCGVDIDQRDGFGETPFNIAVRNMDKDMAKLLMDCDANPFIYNLNGRSSLGIAFAIDDKDEWITLVKEWRINYCDKHVNGGKQGFLKMLEEVNSSAKLEPIRANRLMTNATAKKETPSKKGSDLDLPSQLLGSEPSNGSSETKGDVKDSRSSPHVQENDIQEPAALNSSVPRGCATSEETGTATLQTAHQDSSSPEMPREFTVDNLPLPLISSSDDPNVPTCGEEKPCADTDNGDSGGRWYHYLLYSTVIGASMIYTWKLMNNPKN